MSQCLVVVNKDARGQNNTRKAQELFVCLGKNFVFSSSDQHWQHCRKEWRTGACLCTISSLSLTMFRGNGFLLWPSTSFPHFSLNWSSSRSFDILSATLTLRILDFQSTSSLGHSNYKLFLKNTEGFVRKLTEGMTPEGSFPPPIHTRKANQPEFLHLLLYVVPRSSLSDKQKWLVREVVLLQKNGKKLQ